MFTFVTYIVFLILIFLFLDHNKLNHLLGLSVVCLSSICLLMITQSLRSNMQNT